MQQNDYFYENYYKNIENFQLNLVWEYQLIILYCPNYQGSACTG